MANEHTGSAAAGQHTARTVAMSGRDPHESGRASTPLELLFDLTFVIAIGEAASQLAHFLAAGHVAAGLVGFSFAMFGVCWAWVNFSWFASAFDTDDWLFRVATMVQMVGVLILALGLPRMFASIEHGAHFDNAIMVFGYVVMRLAMVFQWLRAARQSPKRRAASLWYAAAITAAQIGWVAQIFQDFSLEVSFALAAVLILIELGGPLLAEARGGGTPWHAHHIAERYGLLVIIALGEGVVGTVASISAIVEQQGWNLDAVLICVAGTGLTFGMWWIYFMVPSAEVLHAYRKRAFAWGYFHMVIFAAIAATGAGLHVAAYFVEGKAQIGGLATMLTVAVPVGAYVLLVYALYTYLVRAFDPLHVLLLLATAAVVVLSVVLAALGIGMPQCLIVLMLAPMVSVIGYELLGHRHKRAALERVLPTVPRP